MFKKTSTYLLLTYLFLLAPKWVSAATADGTFNVTLTLTSKCEINSTSAASGAVITPVPISYISFQTTAAPGSTSFAVRCTRDLAYGLALDSASVTDGVTGLAYTLNL